MAAAPAEADHADLAGRVGPRLQIGDRGGEVAQHRVFLQLCDLRARCVFVAGRAAERG
jgi:hypothetical protein